MDEQEREWRQHEAHCLRRGVCPHSGCRFALCKASICDCFEYDAEASRQWGTRLRVWWDLSERSPKHWLWRLRHRNDPPFDWTRLSPGPPSDGPEPF